MIENKVFFVTGGASGIGEGMVRRFTADGARVVFSDLQTDKGEAVAAATGAVFVEQDVADAETWERLIAGVLERHGRLDGLANVAGKVTGPQPGGVFDLEAWSRTIAVNLTGTMLGCRTAIEAMRRNPGGPGGSIVNIGSTSAFTAIPTDPAYSASKGGVAALTRSVAAYCAREGLNIRCNTVHPGATLTGITQGAIDQNSNIRAVFESMSPLGRMGTPGDLAAMAAFLMSDDAAYVTGADIRVDGGMLAIHPGM
jgi:3(or 17)beta-hydroxysteroid dehydrogenase